MVLIMTSAQCRMARAALKWSTSDLANQAGVTPTTANRFENGKDAYASTANKLRDAFLQTGLIQFEGEGGVYFLGELVTGDS